MGAHGETKLWVFEHITLRGPHYRIRDGSATPKGRWSSNLFASGSKTLWKKTVAPQTYPYEVPAPYEERDAYLSRYPFGPPAPCGEGAAYLNITPGPATQR